MRKLTAKIAVAGISAAVVLGSVTTSFAVPMAAAPAIDRATEAQPDIQQVQWRGGGYYHGGGYGGGYYRRGYYGGYHGYPYYRSGYRYYDGYWYPLAAFGAGAIIGGAIASQPRYYAAPAPEGINPRHYEWCANRYRSYRAYDNTFQPNVGPRQQCLSPYY